VDLSTGMISASVTIVSFLLILGFYGTYLLALTHLRKHTKEIPLRSMAYDFTPYVSLIIAVYNEENVIQVRLQNIDQLDYPREKLDVLFVDGCSTDRTRDLIEEHIGLGRPFIKLIRQPVRNGYNGAVIDGLRVAKGEIIAISGAEALYDKQALKFLVRHFARSDIGAVTGRIIVLSKKKSVSSDMEFQYRGLQDFLMRQETEVDSPFDIKGEICAARREVCQDFLRKKEILLTEGCIDCCLSCEAKLKGYKTIYDPEATYREYVPYNMGERFRAQARRGTVLIESLLFYKEMLFDKKYGLFGTLILPSHLAMLVIIPLLFVLGLVCLVLTAAYYPLWALAWVLSIFALMTLTPRLRAIVLAFAISQLALIAANLRIVTRRESQMIGKALSTRN